MRDKPGCPALVTDNAGLLTELEWRAVATLRTAARIALDRGAVALPDRVRACIDTAQALLDRTRPAMAKARAKAWAREDGRIAPLAEWMRLQAYGREGIEQLDGTQPGWLRYRDDAVAALAVADAAAEASRFGGVAE